jgi:transcription antitermination factor NusG
MQNPETEMQDTAASTECQWHAVHTRHQYENRVNGLLQTKGFETFFPTFSNLHNWKDRKKEILEALFPGYLFVANVGEQWLQVVSTPGVCGIVSFAGTRAAIPNEEIENLRRAVASPYVLKPHPYLKEGDCVCVSHGPLVGVRGILVRKGSSTKLVLSVQMLGRSASVEIDGKDVAPVSLPRPAERSDLTQVQTPSRNAL